MEVKVTVNDWPLYTPTIPHCPPGITVSDVAHQKLTSIYVEEKGGKSCNKPLDSDGVAGMDGDVNKETEADQNFTAAKFFRWSIMLLDACCRVLRK